MIRTFAGASCLLLAGCATSSLVLLPDDEGQQGEVAVLEANGQPADAVISNGNSRTTLGRRTPTARPLGSKGLKRQEAALLANLPPPPRTYRLYFEQGTVTLTPNSRPVLTALRTDIATRSGPDVEVTGHTDTVGSEDDNDRLSMRRANEVLRWLASNGIDRSLMAAVGRGERELVEATADNVGNSSNRRVEVVVR